MSWHIYLFVTTMFLPSWIIEGHQLVLAHSYHHSLSHLITNSKLLFKLTVAYQGIRYILVLPKTLLLLDLLTSIPLLFYFQTYHHCLISSNHPIHQYYSINLVFNIKSLTLQPRYHILVLLWLKSYCLSFDPHLSSWIIHFR